MSDLLPLSKTIIERFVSGDQTPLVSPNISSGQDCSLVSNVSNITSMDLINSMTYARQRILHDKCLALQTSGAAVEWKNIIPDGSVPYSCPTSLGPTGCYYGNCAFTSKNECLKYSKLPYDPASGDATASTSTNFYLEWRDSVPGSSGATGPAGTCQLGNYSFRRWCEIPKTRNPDNPDTNSASVFTYDETKGTCALTEAYCDSQNQSWDGSNHTCYRSDGQKFAEALFGKTIDAFFSGDCGVNKLSDRRMKERLTKIGPDYAGKGVHLYLYFYTKEALRFHPEYKNMQIGFLADEIETLYPEIISTTDPTQHKSLPARGYKYISFSPEQLKDKKYWRIINTIRNEHLIMGSLLQRYMLKPIIKDK